MPRIARADGRRNRGLRHPWFLAGFACPAVAGFLLLGLLGTHFREAGATAGIFLLTMLPAGAAVFWVAVRRGVHSGYAAFWAFVAAVMVPVWMFALGVGLLMLSAVGPERDAGDPASIARLGTAGITSVKPARVAPPSTRRRPQRVIVQVALNTVYPTRAAARAGEFRRFHWVEFKLAGWRARGRVAGSQNDDRSQMTDGSYQDTSAWVDQYAAVFPRAPRLPRDGIARMVVTACDQDPHVAAGTFCQRRSILLCLAHGTVIGQPGDVDGFPRSPAVNTCRTPSFAGTFQSAASDSRYFPRLRG